MVTVRREVSVEGNEVAVDFDVLEHLGDRDILLVDVDEREWGPVETLGVGCRWESRKGLGLRVEEVAKSAQVSLEAEGLVLLRDDILGEELERAEDWEIDLANVGAGVGNDEVLVQGREGELDGATGLEGESSRDQVGVFEDAVEAILLTLLADDGADTRDQELVASVTSGEVSLDILKGAKDNISEGSGGLDGSLEVVGAELVLARQDGGLVLATEEVGRKRGVELLLGLVRSQSLDHEVALILIRNVEAAAALSRGDVLDQAVEEEHLEVFVEVDELEAGDAQVGDGAWWRRVAVGESAVGKGLNGSELLGIESREAIRQRVQGRSPRGR